MKSIVRKLIPFCFEPARVVRPSWASMRPTLAKWPAQLEVSFFNQLDQYASRPGNRVYCYAELAVCSLAVA